MNIGRKILAVFGGLMVFSGLFWALQGAGIIMWPASSFMLANRNWVYYGIAWAAVGIVLILLTRRKTAS